MINVLYIQQKKKQILFCKFSNLKEKKWKNLANLAILENNNEFIINNLEYAIAIKKKEYQHCFKSGKKNVISGTIGGDWGQIELGKEGCGFFCMGSEKLDLRKKEDILNKVPNILNDSSFEEDYGGKHYSYDINKYKNNNKLEKSEEANKSDNFDKSLARSEKNKSITKNIKNNPENKDCSIF